MTLEHRNVDMLDGSSAVLAIQQVCLEIDIRYISEMNIFKYTELIYLI